MKPKEDTVLVPLDEPGVATLAAPSFCLEEFAWSLPRRLRETLDTLLEWGDKALEKLNMSVQEFHRVKEMILVRLREHLTSCRATTC